MNNNDRQRRRVAQLLMTVVVVVFAFVIRAVVQDRYVNWWLVRWMLAFRMSPVVATHFVYMR